MKLHEITKPRFLTNKVEIEDWLTLMKIQRYAISSTGVVDVDGYVNLNSNNLTNIPVQFGKVTGGFQCFGNKLTSLVGCPSVVGDDFDCRNNKLTSLEGISDLIQEMDGRFYCYNNNIERGGLGLLLIKGLVGINSFNSPLQIINKYVRKDDIFGCQEELMDNGYEEYTKL